MTHQSHHHTNDLQIRELNRAFFIGIGLNLLFTIVEYVLGYINNSLALLSDASHNLSDVATLALSLIGMKLSAMVVRGRFTYGYKKASLFASLINAVLLLVIVVVIIMEAVERIHNPPPVSGNSIMAIAGAGVLINAISAWLFRKGMRHDINARGAFLHLLVDALVSFGVVAAGIIIKVTGWQITDVIISFVIAVVIIISTWGLLVESIRLVMDGIPKKIDEQMIRDAIMEQEGVVNVHHLHIWALSSTTNALTAHITVKQLGTDEWEQIKKNVRHQLEHQGISHVTLEPESETGDCCDADC